MTGTSTGGATAEARGSARGEPRAGAPTVYVMRHLQRAGDADALSEEGRRNAAALPALLAGDPPAAIYVSPTRRARETAAPLAAALGITPTEYAPLDVNGLAAAVSREAGAVLIVGHSNTVPDIIRAIGGTGPASLAETRFGDLWRISGAERRTDQLRVGD